MEGLKIKIDDSLICLKPQMKKYQNINKLTDLRDIEKYTEFLNKKNNNEKNNILKYFKINNINKNYFILTDEILQYLLSQKTSAFINCESKCNCNKLYKNLFTLYFRDNEYIPICCAVSITNPITNCNLFKYINHEVILLGNWTCNL